MTLFVHLTVHSWRYEIKSDFHLLKKYFICFNEGPLKVMKNAFCFILKALFVPKIFQILS